MPVRVVRTVSPNASYAVTQIPLIRPWSKLDVTTPAIAAVPDTGGNAPGTICAESRVWPVEPACPATSNTYS